MFDSQVLAFTGVALLLTVTPGADTLLVIRSVLARGPRAGLLTALGICCGLFFHAALSAIGLSLLLVRSAAAFEVVKLVGAAYLVVLGLQSISGAVRHPAPVVDPAPDVGTHVPNTGRWRAFFEGLLNNVLNPKVAIFYLAFLPQFLSPGDPLVLKSTLLAGIHVALGMLWFSLIIMAMGRLRGMLSRPRVQQRLEAATGAVLIALGVRLALERR